MRSTDLRIGNYNLFNSKLDRINDGYDIDHVRDDKEGLHKPIPLTEDWLLRLGKGKGNLIINGLHEKGVLYFNSGADYIEFDAKHIKYVHQLQNLYHALTGKELTIQG